jgi:hypothetical protein
VPPDSGKLTAILIDGPTTLDAVLTGSGALADECWFITPDHVGRGLGLGWAKAVQDALFAQSPGWRLIADCGGSAGDATHAITLGLPGIVFTGDHLQENTTADIAQRLSSMAEERGMVFLTERPVVQTALMNCLR